MYSCCLHTSGQVPNSQFPDSALKSASPHVRHGRCHVEYGVHVFGNHQYGLVATTCLLLANWSPMPSGSTPEVVLSTISASSTHPISNLACRCNSIGSDTDLCVACSAAKHRQMAPKRLRPNLADSSDEGGDPRSRSPAGRANQTANAIDAIAMPTCGRCCHHFFLHD